ncbi:unnamed protein product [Moneuplotes crassus]|uniref:Pyridoxal phosphate homeostasis protein n=1 Tax=Euplotes crassus TaxID=5936 RepID=A0AAD1XU33_EUPCR|nr:unnamed protein product [Moneuplotes crassus]
MFTRLQKLYQPQLISKNLSLYRSFCTASSHSTVVTNLIKIQSDVQKAVDFSTKSPLAKVLPVTKRIDPELVREAYAHGERHFGENYFQSLRDRAADFPSDIKWHFIGHLQSNKANGLLKIPNLHVVETVDNTKLAKKLNKACESNERTLNIFLQVNSSGEVSKSGLPPSEVLNAAEIVIHECTSLNLKGLMSIGKIGDKKGFELMYKLKTDLCEKYDIDPDKFELSIGTSADFEDAIIHGGATEVRVGTQIFGERKN